MSSKQRFVMAVFLAQALACGGTSVGPGELWERVLRAKGGRERLRAVHSLAIYMQPAPVVLAGPPTNWLCVFPNRYFQYVARGMGDGPSATVVDAASGRVATDVNGMPRRVFQMSGAEQDRLTLNQIVYLLETGWLHPEPVSANGNELTVEAGGRTFRLHLNNAPLPVRVYSPSLPGRKPKVSYDYHLSHYRDYEGVQLPTRVTLVSHVAWTWDVDYEVDARYNPAVFARTPDLAAGPEPWRQQ